MVSPETLRRYPLFARQSYYMLQEIALLSRKVKLEADDWLFHENEEATKLYLIIDGAISLTTYLFLNGHGKHLAAMSPLGKGEIVGWSSLIKPHIYQLGAQATEKTELIAIEAVPLGELLDDNPAFGYFLLKKVSEVISERLDSKCIQLLSLVLDSKERSTAGMP